MKKPTCSIYSVSSDDPSAKVDSSVASLEPKLRGALVLKGRVALLLLCYHLLEGSQGSIVKASIGELPLSHIQDCLEVDTYNSPHTFIWRTSISFNNQGPISCVESPLPLRMIPTFSRPSENRLFARYNTVFEPIRGQILSSSHKTTSHAHKLLLDWFLWLLSMSGPLWWTMGSSG